ncbi:MAG: hypothetical protein ABI718_02315 [Acidobacteriota bacterium]
MRPARMAGGGLDFLPPSEWWRKDEISRTVGLSTDQMASLDALHSQSDDIDRIQRDLVTALRDVRTTLEGEHPTSDDILTAGRRYQTLRDDLLTRQLQLLVAERSILTQQQWATLEAQMRSTARPQERRGRQGDYGGGGRRGGGMGGRRPGWPG